MKRPLLKRRGEVYDEDIARERISRLLELRSDCYALGDFLLNADYMEADSICAFLDKNWDYLRGFVGVEGRERVSLFPYFLGESKEELSVVIGEGVCEFISGFSQSYEKFAVVIDSQVCKHWEGSLGKIFRDFSDRVVYFSVSSGESSKSILEVERLSNELLAGGFTRKDALVAIGGGVVGDLAGLVSSLYGRGMALFHIPTTVVSQVDSAIGGKTGVNLSGGKNMLGTFYPARSVICDVEFLSSLPEREYLSGLSEVIKYGLIADRDFFLWITSNVEKIISRDTQALSHLVSRSVNLKLKHVVSDFRDLLGLRARLNFGHTFGHALENISGYGTYLHGEAIALGMVFACRFGEKLGISKAGLSDSLVEILERFKQPVGIDSVMLADVKTWEALLRADKKRESSEMVNFVFLKDLGESFTKEVSVKELSSSLSLLG